MRVIAKSTTFVLIVCLFIISVATVVNGQEQSKPESIWIDKALKSEIISLEEHGVKGSHGPTDLSSLCVPLTYYERNLPLLPYMDKVETSCAYRLGVNGFIHGGNLIVNGAIAGSYSGMSNLYKPVENTDAIVAKEGNAIRLISKLTFIAKPSYNFFNGKLSYTIPYEPSQIIRDSHGNTINWSNGRLTATKEFGSIVIDQHGGSFVKVNEVTKETLLFGSGTFFRQGGTTRKPKFVHFAGGARYALVGENEGEAYLYDLNRCTGEYSRVNSNAQAYKSEDCDYISISDYLEDEYNDGRSVWIENVEFDSASQIKVVFGFRDFANETKIFTARIVPDGEEFSDRAQSYVALGDSFASGEGDTNDNWYELGTNVSENKCHLSRRSYPYLLNNEQYFDEFHSVACSGAVTEDVISAVQKDTLNRNNLPSNKLGDWYPGFRPQSEYLKLDNVAVSTISISGNDVAFAGKLQECVLGLGTCKYAEDGPHRALVATEISSIYDTLKRTYSELINTTESNTKIYSVSYPQFVQGSGGTCGLNVHLNDDERYFIGQAVTYMNQVIKAASEEAGVYYLDVEDALEGHNLCSGASDGFMAVNGLTFGDDIKLPGELSLTGPVLASLTRVGIGTESYHPNQKGHQLLRDRINTLTSYDLISHQVCANGEKVCPSEARNVPLPDESYWGEEAVAFATLLNDNPNQELPTTPRSLNMIVRDVQNPSGSGIEKNVSISDLLPGSNVELELQSNPTSLGTFTVDQDGTLETTITLPDDVELGVHTLNAYGTNIIGEEVHYYEHVAVYDQSITTNECFFVQTSGTDSDDDGIDDACDGYYLKQSVGPSVDENEQATATSNHIQDSGVTSENASSTTLDTGFNGLSSNIVSFFPDDTNNTVSINSDRGSVLGDSSQQSLSGLHAIATQDVGNNSWDEWFMIVAVSILLGGTIAIIYRRTH